MCESLLLLFHVCSRLHCMFQIPVTAYDSHACLFAADAASSFLTFALFTHSLIHLHTSLPSAMPHT